jgi:hypothetical protein
MPTVAVMQPYLFPFVGYFQLVDAVDVFVFYDDVDFITRGWINRNNIMVQGHKHLFTVPVKNASQNKAIDEIQVSRNEQWLKKFQKTLYHAYGQHSNYEQTKELIHETLESIPCSIAYLASKSVKLISKTIGLKTEFLNASELGIDRNLDKADRLIAVCKKLNADHYVNAIGGLELYDKSYFSKEGVELSFLKPNFRLYEQQKTEQFVSGISVIDILMNVEADRVHKDVIEGYSLI